MISYLAFIFVMQMLCPAFPISTNSDTLNKYFKEIMLLVSYIMYVYVSSFFGDDYNCKKQKNNYSVLNTIVYFSLIYKILELRTLELVW